MLRCICTIYVQLYIINVLRILYIYVLYNIVYITIYFTYSNICMLYMYITIYSDIYCYVLHMYIVSQHKKKGIFKNNCKENTN